MGQIWVGIVCFSSKTWVYMIFYGVVHKIYGNGAWFLLRFKIHVIYIGLKWGPWTLFGKSILQVPDTGTWVLGNTTPFLRSSIVSFWITPARSKEREYHIFRQYWYTRNVPVFTNTGTLQYLGPEVYFFPLFLFHQVPLSNACERSHNS